MEYKPFVLSIDDVNGSFSSFFKTQDEAEAALLEWARSHDYTAERDDLLRALEQAGVDVYIHRIIEGARTAIPLEPFERPLQVKQ